MHKKSTGNANQNKQQKLRFNWRSDNEIQNKSNVNMYM